MSPTPITDKAGRIADWYLARLEDEAIDGVPISPDDALLIIDRLRDAEAKLNKEETKP